MYLSDTQKRIQLLRTLGLQEMRSLPLHVLWKMQRFLRNEKLTRIDGKLVINSFLPPFPSEAFRTLASGMRSLVEGRAVPVSAYLALTNRCRFRCWHCSKEYRESDELPIDAVLRTIWELQDLGVSIIGLTGGEPLLRDELEEIVGAVDERSATVLFTSGDGLTHERAAELKRRGLFGIAVSLDHFDPQIHNRRRGREDAFETAVNAIRISRAKGFYTMIQLVATRDIINAETIEDYLRLARDLDVHEIRLLEPMPTGRLLNGDQCCCLTEEERAELRKLHERTNRDRTLPKVCAFAHIEHGDMYGCGAGFQHMYIDADGNVCPCDFVPVSFGNVKKEGVKTIWRRLNGAFSRPRRCCFLMQNAERLKKAFTGKLPIPYEDVMNVCRFNHDGSLPDYYRALGWR